MKIPKEYVLIIIAGMFLLSYLLDAVVDPLPATFPTPYHYFNGPTLGKYAFSTTSILIRGMAFLLTPMWLISFFQFHPGAKGGIFLVTGSLMQLYALQEVATNAQVIPLEWAISLAFGGAILLIPAIFNILKGLINPYTTTPTDQIQ
ncbi:hypothetical protein ACFL1M_04300 [Patescibacteria group bacterium]